MFIKPVYKNMSTDSFWLNIGVIKFLGVVQPVIFFSFCDRPGVLLIIYHVSRLWFYLPAVSRAPGIVNTTHNRVCGYSTYRSTHSWE